MIRWKLLPGNRRYEVSDQGDVRHVGSRELVQKVENHNGYFRVRLKDDEGRRWHRVHVLVLTAFVGPRPSERHHGAHAPDSSPANNALSNLAWKLPEQNEADKVAKNAGGVLKPTPPEKVAAIRLMVESGNSYSHIARELDVHRNTVSNIARGVRRASVANPPRSFVQMSEADDGY